MKILVTGCCGFIGYHLTKNLFLHDFEVSGIDSINDYYDPKLKKARLQSLEESSSKQNFLFKKLDISNSNELDSFFKENSFDVIIHLAAQAGVRYSIENPFSYIKNNLVGFSNLIEIAKKKSVKRFIYASTSSVYGANKKLPFSEEDRVDHPIQLYAATKRSNELVAHSYSSLFGLPTIGLRFFTVYGPWGRPDMALFKFTKNILKEKPIEIFNNGKHSRDFTYIDDIVSGIVPLINNQSVFNNIIPSENSNDNKIPFKIFNIGRGKPEKLEDFISVIEKELGIRAIKKYLPLQSGDVTDTYADISELNKLVGYNPSFNIEVGVKSFIDWYRDFYNI